MGTACADDELSPLDLVRRELERQIENETLELPLLPAVAQEVLSLSSNDDADAGDLSNLIHRDQSLASHMLRIANSPAYMARTEITSLRQAVARLGTAVIAEIALAVSLRGEVFDVPGYQKDIAHMWRHSLASALWCKEIARQRDREPDTAFLCGLLHHIGKPIVLHTLIKLSKAHELKVTPQDVRTILEFHHVGVGRLVARGWKLPRPVVEAVSHYYSYEDADEFRDQAMMTHLADLLATFTLAGDGMPEERLRSSQVLADLGLGNEPLDEMLSRREELAEMVDSMAV